MYIETLPGECYVAEDNDRIVAFIINHISGTLGWFGPLAVLPEVQQYGVGKLLVEKSLHMFMDNGCETVGLETMPNSPSNLGFYYNLGFVPHYLTHVLAIGSLEYEQQDSTDTGLHIWTYEGHHEKSTDIDVKIQSLQLQFIPGVDYLNDIRKTEKYEFGVTICAFHDKELLGFAIGHTRSYFANRETPNLRVKVLVFNPKAPVQFFNWFIDQLRKQAGKFGKSELHIEINARYYKCLTHLLHQRFRIRFSNIRMTYPGYGEHVSPEMIHCTRWVG